ncbi:hypothetical protein V8F20_009557 [Naviculisporaceae sp. PSN 640]
MGVSGACRSRRDSVWPSIFWAPAGLKQEPTIHPEEAERTRRSCALYVYTLEEAAQSQIGGFLQGERRSSYLHLEEVATGEKAASSKVRSFSYTYSPGGSCHQVISSFLQRELPLAPHKEHSSIFTLEEVAISQRGSLLRRGTLKAHHKEHSSIFTLEEVAQGEGSFPRCEMLKAPLACINIHSGGGCLKGNATSSGARRSSLGSINIPSGGGCSRGNAASPGARRSSLGSINIPSGGGCSRGNAASPGVRKPYLPPCI